ncbi:MAG: dephospho-CoA kinase [Acidiferrobacterales bacterium]
MTLRIGLTGGIGSGKSAVATRFANRGIPVIDTDVITRKLVEPGEAALTEISEALGKEFISKDGRLHRARLRKAIFENEATRKRLEAILHPRVAKVVAREVDSLDLPYCIIVIPLLFEAAQEYLVDRVLVVDAPEELQVDRVITRDHTDAERVKQIMASQLDRKSRLARADDVIVNDGDESGLEDQVNRLHEHYLQIAR